MAVISSSSMGELVRLRTIIAYLVKEYGEANEDWTCATVKIPAYILMQADAKFALAKDIFTMQEILSVQLDQAPDGPHEAPMGGLKATCKWCSRIIWYVQPSLNWLHEGSGKEPCGSKYPGHVAERYIY